MEAFANPFVARSAFAVGGLLLFLAWENATPFRTPRQARWPHYATNIALGVSNTIILRLTFGGLLVVLARITEVRGLGLLNALALPAPWKSVFAVVLLDLITYLVHRSAHRFPVLWRVHKVHHSDHDFDVTTGLRFHALEVFLSAGVRAVAIPLVGADVSGVIAFEIALLFASQFQHCNLRLPEDFDRPLRWMTVTPSMHRIHHSERPTETNSNFSTIFSWWDRLLGTYRESVNQESIVVGLREIGPGKLGLLDLLRMPFRQRPRSPRRLAAEELHRDLSGNTPPLVLDVRSAGEFTGELGHVAGATLVPLPELGHRLGELAAHRKRRIVAV